MKQAVGCVDSAARPEHLWVSHGVLAPDISALDCKRQFIFYWIRSAIWYVPLWKARRCLSFSFSKQANEAGCVSYANPYKALYGSHSGQ